jgi:hypothetical protein
MEVAHARPAIRRCLGPAEKICSRGPRSVPCRQHCSPTAGGGRPICRATETRANGLGGDRGPIRPDRRSPAMATGSVGKPRITAPAAWSPTAIRLPAMSTPGAGRAMLQARCTASGLGSRAELGHGDGMATIIVNQVALAVEGFGDPTDPWFCWSEGQWCFPGPTRCASASRPAAVM